MLLSNTENSFLNTKIKRKFQVCNGYLLEFDQLTRVIHYLFENKNESRISRIDLQENTGLSNRQIESLVSIGAALGIIKRGKQTLTEVGTLIAENDIFFESKETLAWLHFIGAGSLRNLIWFEVINTVLSNNNSLNQDKLNESLRTILVGQYTDRTIKKHLYEEVRFIVDAYLSRNFRKLELIRQTSEDLLYLNRYTKFDPLVFGAIIYHYGNIQETGLFQMEQLVNNSGSPGKVFNLNISHMRQLIDILHNKGYLKYETTHNLDQIRLKSEYSAMQFLKACLTGQALEVCDEPSKMEVF